MTAFLQAYAPFIVQFFLAVVGGGIISAYLTEKWTRRRERYAILIEHVANLIRSYHIYVRALNRSHSLRSNDELDHAHAAFYAEAKLLGLSPVLAPESVDLIDIADHLYKIRKSKSEAKSDVETELQPIFRDFAGVLERIQSKLSKKGAL